jgi:transposase InsO family protein
VAPNLRDRQFLDRQFEADGPNRKWTGDITYVDIYVDTREGWLYLAVVIWRSCWIFSAAAWSVMR